VGGGARALLTMVAGRVLVRDGIELACDDAVRARVMADGEVVQRYVRALPGSAGRAS